MLITWLEPIFPFIHLHIHQAFRCIATIWYAHEFYTFIWNVDFGCINWSEPSTCDLLCQQLHLVSYQRSHADPGILTHNSLNAQNDINGIFALVLQVPMVRAWMTRNWTNWTCSWLGNVLQGSLAQDHYALDSDKHKAVRTSMKHSFLKTL